MMGLKGWQRADVFLAFAFETVDADFLERMAFFNGLIRRTKCGLRSE